MILYKDALQIIYDTLCKTRLETETVPLAASLDRVCAVDLVANIDIQPFDNSAMDGFAVRQQDLSLASEASPVFLEKAGIISAGQDIDGLSVEKGMCWHVMTGAPLPAMTNTVIPVEEAIIKQDRIGFRKKPATGQHIRYAGEDFKKGDALLSAGDKITAAHILPMATLGVADVEVFRKPRILFIPTGTEIIDDLDAPLAYGQIYNSNKYYAASFLEQCGAQVFIEETICDDAEHFRRVLEKADQDNYDIIISSGAVSAGDFDFVAQGIKQHGATILYHKIAMKPGKPNLMAVMPSGVVYFGLPGNPVATAVGLRFFVAKALRLMRGQKPERPFFARAVNGFARKAGLHMVLKGRLVYSNEGAVAVEILDGQESFKVSPFLRMTCWIHLPAEKENIKAGDIVEVYPLLP